MTKILLVEDDKSLREIYGVRLLAEGYDIVSAGDGEEALAMAIKDRPALIVSDVMMPKISGFDMLDILRSTTETKDIKVIMMTALSSEDQRKRGESLGADRYLVKSQVGIEDVVRTVHEVLGDAPGAAPAPSSQPPVPVAQSAPAAEPASRAQPLPAPGSSSANLAASAPQPQPAAGGMPQPTAPFSTPRPAGLGDRIIQPLDTSELDSASDDLAKRMEQELSDAPAPSTPPQPAASSIDTATQPAPAEPTSENTTPSIAPPQPPSPSVTPSAPAAPSPSPAAPTAAQPAPAPQVNPVAQQPQPQPQPQSPPPAATQPAPATLPSAPQPPQPQPTAAPQPVSQPQPASPSPQASSIPQAAPRPESGMNFEEIPRSSAPSA